MGTGKKTLARVSGAVYSLLAYEGLPDAIRKELDQTATRAAYDSVQGDHDFVLERVKYWSDGLSVIAYVYRPARNNQTRRPAIIYSRGSFIAGDLAPALAPMFHRLALEGFTIVAPQYRGSDGGEGTDEMGGADVRDVLNAVRLATNIPGVDSSQIFLYGESRSGMMTYQAIRAHAPVKAAAVVGAFSDLDSLLARDPRSRGAAAQIWPDYATRSGEIAIKRSAERWASELTVPLLILHGGADPQVSPRQALRLALKLDDLDGHTRSTSSRANHTRSWLAPQSVTLPSLHGFGGIRRPHRGFWVFAPTNAPLLINRA